MLEIEKIRFTFTKASSPNTRQTEVGNALSHLLPQSEAFQGDILPHQSNGVWELDFEVSRIFPGGT